MSLYSKLRGTVEQLFQLGLDRAQLKAQPTPGFELEVRNPTDAAFVVVRAADAVGADDLTPLRQTLGVPAILTTTTNVQQTCGSFVLADNTVYWVDAVIIARRTDVAGRALYLKRCCTYRQGGGGATLEGGVDSPLTRESTPAYDATLDVSGNSVRVRVAGQTGHTVNWQTYLRVWLVT